MTAAELSDKIHEWSDGLMTISVEYKTTPDFDLKADREYNAPSSLEVKITGKALDGHDLNVSLYGNFSRGLEAENWHFTIVDLTGNGDGTGVSNQGYGTLIVRIVAQCLTRIFPDDPTIRIVGKLSPSGDHSPDSHQRRAHFWGRMATLDDPDNEITRFETTLGQMLAFSEPPEDHTDGIESRYVDLDAFWPIDDRPLILPADVEALRAVDLSQYGPNPSRDDLSADLSMLHRENDSNSKVVLAGGLIFSGVSTFFILLTGIASVELSVAFAGLIASVAVVITAALRTFGSTRRRIDKIEEQIRVARSNDIQLRTTLENQSKGIMRRLSNSFDGDRRLNNYEVVSVAMNAAAIGR